MVDTLRNDVGRPPEDILVRQNLKHYRRELKFKKKLSEVFKFWWEIVVKKAEGHTKLVKMSKKYQEKRKKVFGDNPPRTAVKHNRFIDNMDELYGEIIDKFLLLSNTKQKRVLKSKHPIKLIFKLTNLSFKEVFPEEEDNKDFQEILLTSEFEKDEVIKRVR
jgi:hypothetical protein